MAKQPAFYMLYVEGQSSPTYKHPTLDSAKEEARRLAERLKARVYILQAQSFTEIRLFNEEDLAYDPTNLPF